MKLLKLTFFVLFVFTHLNLPAQRVKATTSKNTDRKCPTTFLISKSEFDNLFSHKVNETINAKTNKYLDKSNILVSTINGDMRFMKIKLNYFANAFLMIQINGSYSTQIFILSEDKSVFYKGKPDKNDFIMTKCSENEIVSE